MDVIKNRRIEHGAVSPFDFRISYVEITRDSPNNQYDSHVHSECEIYVNLSGDVSFMVEKQIYPILPGNIVITRPYEYHHCIYHSNALHKHFWILFSVGENERLLGRFFDRPIGKGNLLALSAEQQTELTALCHEMIDGKQGAAEQQYRFFRLLHLLNGAQTSLPPLEQERTDVASALDYINTHYASPITVAELAALSHVSVNTLERHFQEILHIPPSVYLKKKRLSVAAELLHRGATVGEACRECGFSDYSKFIALFKQTYGTTPLKYGKQTRKKTE
ncbi:MAG: helix-turn-helix transcriptional regulator [Clostridia bacterium]|nr:helix-turn-helix transcriptional regulator [Clostridia bacterium]